MANSFGTGMNVAAVELGWDGVDATAAKAYGVKIVAKNADAGGVGVLGWNVFLADDIKATRDPSVKGLQPVFSIVTLGQTAGTDHIYAQAWTTSFAQNPMEWVVYLIRGNTSHSIGIDAVEAIIGPWRLLVTWHQLGSENPPVI